MTAATRMPCSLVPQVQPDLARDFTINAMACAPARDDRSTCTAAAATCTPARCAGGGRPEERLPDALRILQVGAAGRPAGFCSEEATTERRAGHAAEHSEYFRRAGRELISVVASLRAKKPSRYGRILAGRCAGDYAIAARRRRRAPRRWAIAVAVRKYRDRKAKKFGAMLGDHVEVGCGTILNPGSVVGPHTNIYPLSSVRGFVPGVKVFTNVQVKWLK